MKRLVIAIVIVAGTIALWLNVGGAKDYLRFQFWEHTHEVQFQSAKTHADVLGHWDGWGFAGNDNDRYLVSDPSDTLSGATGARRGVTLPIAQAKIAEGWGKEHKLKCGVVWVSRLKQGFYLITTYNCTLDV